MSVSEVEILLVEDSPEDRELTIRALKKHNLLNRLHAVQDGEEALEFLFATGRYSERAGARNPRIVCLDLKLPRVDGLEVLKRIRADQRTRQIPVVVLTSSREERDIVETYRLGVNSYVVKPVEFEDFAKAVSELGMYWLLLNQLPVEVR